MSDLISRQDAIDMLGAMQGRCTSKAALIQNSKIWQQIKDLPSAEQEPQWIPCSERLPNGQTEVIVSCLDDSGDTPFDYTGCGWVTNDGEYWIVDNEINNYVIAWMPLPAPYEGRHE